MAEREQRPAAGEGRDDADPLAFPRGCVRAALAGALVWFAIVAGMAWVIFHWC